jgi:hypothetical protein
LWQLKNEAVLYPHQNPDGEVYGVVADGVAGAMSSLSVSRLLIP